MLKFNSLFVLFSAYNNTHILSHSFKWVRSLAGLSEQGFTRLQPRFWLGCILMWRLHWGRICFQAHSSWQDSCLWWCIRPWLLTGCWLNSTLIFLPNLFPLPTPNPAPHHLLRTKLLGVIFDFSLSHVSHLVHQQLQRALPWNICWES